MIRLAWLGIPTSNYPAMVSFLRDTMGLRVEFDEPATTELSLPHDDRLQVFAPGHPYFAFFQDHAQGLVPLFEVEDAQQATGPGSMCAHRTATCMSSPAADEANLTDRPVPPRAAIPCVWRDDPIDLGSCNTMRQRGMPARPAGEQQDAAGPRASANGPRP